MKKTFLLLVIILTIIITFIIFFLFLKESTWIREKSPDNSWELIVNLENSFSFGPYKVIVYVKKSNWLWKKKFHETEIYNGLASLNEKNYELSWINNHTVKLILRGDAQTGERVLVDFKKFLDSLTKINQGYNINI